MCLSCKLSKLNVVRKMSLPICSHHLYIHAFFRFQKWPTPKVLFGIFQILPIIKHYAYQLVWVSEEDWLHWNSWNEGTYNHIEILQHIHYMKTSFTIKKKMNTKWYTKTVLRVHINCLLNVSKSLVFTKMKHV